MLAVVAIAVTRAVPADAAALAECQRMLRRLDGQEARMDEAKLPAWTELRCAERMMLGSGSSAQTLVDTSYQRAHADPASSAAKGIARCHELLQQMDQRSASDTIQGRLEASFSQLQCSKLLLASKPLATKILVP